MRLLNKTNLFSYFLCILLLSGCNYKLRDSYQGLNNKIVTISYENDPLNLSFINTFQKQGGTKKLYLNEIGEDSDLSMQILEHEVTRYSAALGTGARTKEARMEYVLIISFTLKGKKEEIVLEIKDSSNYSFDESRILAIEEVEKRLKENFFTNSINRINFSLRNLLNESI